MGQVTHEQANLLLRLYELRRESRLREARAWFYSHFEAGTPEELMTKYPMGSEESASLRMVISYWDMAAGLANRGLIDDEMFFENSAEGWIVWGKSEGDRARPAHNDEESGLLSTSGEFCKAL